MNRQSPTGIQRYKKVVWLLLFVTLFALWPVHSVYASRVGDAFVEALDMTFEVASFGLLDDPVSGGIDTVVGGGADLGVSLIATILELIANIGTWLLKLVSDVLGSVVTIGSFVTNPFVAQGWPFLQGFANFGFILALLVIAVTTALRVDIGGGVRRLLPRLLLGALLINFSLLIGGLLIDFSRLLMAIFTNLATNGQDVTELGPNIMLNSGIVDAAFNINFSNPFRVVRAEEIAEGMSRIAFLVRLAQGVVFIWGLTIGMLVIMVTLLIRYVFLLLLLIVSPLVYVAIAFPGASGIAKKWWSSFLTNVFYGPIAMFALVMLAAIGPAERSFRGLENNSIALNFLGLVITVVLLFVVATSGKKWGAAGADAAINGTKRTGNYLRRNPVKTAALAGTLATGGLGGALLGAGGALAGRRVLGKAKQQYQDYSAQRTKDKEVRRKQQAKRSYGTKTAKGVSKFLGTSAPVLNQTEKKEQQAAQRASQRIGKDPTKVAGELKSQDLLKPHVAAGLSDDAYDATLKSDSAPHEQALIAGTINQKQVSKGQAKALTSHLRVTIDDKRKKLKAAKDSQRKLERRATEQRDLGNTAAASALQAQADTERENAQKAEAALKVATGQFKTAVGNKAIVDELDDADVADIINLGEDAITTQLIRTQNRPEGGQNRSEGGKS